MLAVAEVVAALEAAYDPALAEQWDAVGLVCGDPGAPVRRVLFAVDPVAAVAAEAVARGADLLVTHHPLFLRGVHGIAETTEKGRVVSALVRSGVALQVAHTNADLASPGVSDALAAALGLHEVAPLAPVPAAPLDKVVTFVPQPAAEEVIDALAAAGAGQIGDYSRCAFTAQGTGTFRPGQGAHPAVGEVGRTASVAETRVEMVLPRGRRSEVVAALRAAHPYEEPAFDVLELALPPGRLGLGRVGELTQPVRLDTFLERAAAALPATAAGLRAAGDPAAPVRRIAVCGGAGDSLLDPAARAGADVLLTADLRHHQVSEAVEGGRLALVDAAHWATEWPWLPAAAARLRADLAGGRGDTVEVVVSTLRTDPWTAHAASSNR